MQVNKWIGISVAIFVLLSAGSYILRKATEKTDKIDNRVQSIVVHDGGKVLIGKEEKKSDERLWSIGIYGGKLGNDNQFGLTLERRF